MDFVWNAKRHTCHPFHLTKCFVEGGVDILGLIKKKKKRNTPPFLLEINEELKKKGKGFKMAAVNESDLTIEERKLIQQILIQTEIKNQNNITRTKSYLDVYLRHPEIHWAFLGHMVSRNGGWNMTDLKGDLLSHLLTEQEQQFFFSFLERGNWLIFQDIYPQFLLYEESIKRNKPLFPFSLFSCLYFYGNDLEPLLEIS